MFFKCIFYFCSLIWVLCFCLVVFLCFFVPLVLFGAFVAFCAFWCVRNLFVKKKIKEFKTALITSFILLLKFILLQAWIFLITIFFQLSQFCFQLSESIITIFFNYNNFFQLSQSFLSIFFNLFTTCDTIFMKISQRRNFII